MKRRPSVLLEKLLQSELIGCVERPPSAKTVGHEFSEVAVFGDRHPDHRPLRNSRIVLVALKRGGGLPDLKANKNQGQNAARRSNDLRQVGQLFERHDGPVTSRPKLSEAPVRVLRSSR